MLFSDNDLERGMTLGGLIAGAAPIIWRMVGKLVVFGITAFAAALGKELFAEYVRRNFGRERNHR